MAATIKPIEENSANKENYENAQQTIDKVLEKVSALKESEANNELKRQIDELDTAYERAIKLRMMRIDTLTAHCEDRDGELVRLRKLNNALETRNCWKTRFLGAVAFTGTLMALDYALPGTVATALEYAVAALVIAVESVKSSALCSAAASGIVTLALSRRF